MPWYSKKVEQSISYHHKSTAGSLSSSITIVPIMYVIYDATIYRMKAISNQWGNTQISFTRKFDKWPLII